LGLLSLLNHEDTVEHPPRAPASRPSAIQRATPRGREIAIN
jgi:hypothetical protein